MKLFVTLGVYEVVFWRLMILYTQYCSMSVFIYVSSLPASFCSRWFHLQASEMVFFVTLTIANVLFYWALVLHVHFFPMNFFFSVCQFFPESISLQVFQVVPARSVTVFQVILRSFLLLIRTKILTIEKQKEVQTMRFH